MQDSSEPEKMGCEIEEEEDTVKRASSADHELQSNIVPGENLGNSEEEIQYSASESSENNREIGKLPSTTDCNQSGSKSSPTCRSLQEDGIGESYQAVVEDSMQQVNADEVLEDDIPNLEEKETMRTGGF